LPKLVEHGGAALEQGAAIDGQLDAMRPAIE
jgi:hypothetical protein